MRLPFAALALLAAAPLIAQTQAPTSQPGKTDPKLVPAGTYQIDTNHTQITWMVNHLNISLLQGQFGASGGSLTIDPANPAATKLEVNFQIDQLSTTSAHFTEHLKSADYFETAKYPTARFVSTKVAWAGTSATVTGDLTIKNITKPVTLAVTMVGAGPNPVGGKLNFGFRATTPVNRTDFGLGRAVPIVADKVDLVINAAFLAA